MTVSMRIAHATWVRYHHIDLARELEARGELQAVFTCLPWWRANQESAAQAIPRCKIKCNFAIQGLRRVVQRVPLLNSLLADTLAILDTKVYSRWVESRLPPCDAFIGLSGTGLHAGRKAQSSGAGYVMDRGSTHIRHADRVLADEYAAWGVPYRPVAPWLIANEEAEAAQANLVIVPSHFAAKTFEDQGVSRAKLRIVPYGINLKEFFPVGQPPQGIFRLLFVGQFSLRKGVPYLLQAFRQWKNPNKELVVVGNVGREVRDIVGKYAADDINFVGTVSRAKVKEFMSSAHALVLPSVEEGLALVQAQAMACGCPVIATPNTGSETLFMNGEHGLILPPRDIPALVGGFERLADDEHFRQRLSTNALQHAQRIGGWSDYAANVSNACAEAQVLAQATQRAWLA